MTLTQAVDYAFRAVLFLAKLPRGKVVDTHTIAEAEDIPMRFLLKILHLLTKAGIVKSYRGVGGGFALYVRPEKLTLLDIVQAVEGPILINRCLTGAKTYCSSRTSKCVIHDVLWDIQEEAIKKLSKVDFATLVKKETQES